MQKLAVNQSLILILLLLGAAGFYFYGFTNGAIAFLVIGAIFEMVFWLGFIATNSNSDDSASS
jgi:4-hydroxybenzoate polyprenyltransferase